MIKCYAFISLTLLSSINFITNGMLCALYRSFVLYSLLFILDSFESNLLICEISSYTCNFRFQYIAGNIIGLEAGYSNTHIQHLIRQLTQLNRVCVCVCVVVAGHLYSRSQSISVFSVSTMHYRLRPK